MKEFADYCWPPFKWTGEKAGGFHGPYELRLRIIGCGVGAQPYGIYDRDGELILTCKEEEGEKFTERWNTAYATWLMVKDTAAATYYTDGWQPPCPS